MRWAVDLTSNAAALLLAVLVTTGQRMAYVPGPGGQPYDRVFCGGAKSDASRGNALSRRIEDLSTVELRLLRWGGGSVAACDQVSVPAQRSGWQLSGIAVNGSILYCGFSVFAVRLRRERFRAL
ncbi:hypothetical protein [Saccharopolyspora sp. ASAGF58]|uniref:hypothetical protein n=1 Tax=Saccharopolyspora sp. ASAGF58 TaxID=2719023 RepID=UPI0035300FA3